MGVVQHTPDPEQTIAKLIEFAKPGGMLVIDHYSERYKENLPRRWLRQLALRLPPRLSLLLVQVICRTLIPFHRVLRPPYRFRGPGRLRNWLLKTSPVLDYYEHLPDLPRRAVEMWMELDTHDAVTDYYKHLRTPAQILACLEANGLNDVVAAHAGNGIEARGRKPVVSGT